MEILKAISEGEKKECFEFFKKLWMEEFDKEVNNYEAYSKTDVYYIEKDWKVIWAANFLEVKTWNWFNPEIFIYKKDAWQIWRVWVLSEYRWNWYWEALVRKYLEAWKELWHTYFVMPSAIQNIKFYEKFGFKVASDCISNWNTEMLYMDLEIN